MRNLNILLVSLLISIGALAQTINKIPTVVHVVYNSTFPDISDAEITDYISEVNKGYRKQLAPVFTPRPEFVDLWADTEIELCLAATDPDGNPTNAITHTYTTEEYYNIYATNPVPSIAPYWDDSQYLNIWIMPTYPEPGFPDFVMGGTSADPTDGYPWLGCIISLNGPIEIRTQIMTHEVGHCLGLLHLGSDGVDDTPVGMYPIYANTGYPTICNPDDLLLNSSSDDGPYWAGLGIDPPDMIENFMNFDLPCAFMFTEGQKVLMNNFIDTHYSTMVNTNCSSPSGTPDLTLYYDNVEVVGNTVDISLEVNNEGDGECGATSKMGFYLSLDNDITTSDYFIGEDNISNLSAGANELVNFSGDVSIFGIPDGNYYVGAIADYETVIAESDETNNTFNTISPEIQLLTDNVINIKKGNNVSIYPNPSTGIFTIEGNDIQKIELVDITGKTVLNVIASEAKQTVNLTQNPKGIYFAKITTSEGVITKKLIVQ